MSAPETRRGFLRELTTLPLIGGGVVLLGAPTAVAEPITDALLDSYDCWLEYERRFLQWERHRNTDMVERMHQPFVMQMRDAEHNPIGTATSCDWIPMANGGARFHHNTPGTPGPTTRAALVLSAVGCDWRRGEL